MWNSRAGIRDFCGLGGDGGRCFLRRQRTPESASGGEQGPLLAIRNAVLGGSDPLASLHREAYVSTQRRQKREPQGLRAVTPGRLSAGEGKGAEISRGWAPLPPQPVTHGEDEKRVLHSERQGPEDHMAQAWSERNTLENIRPVLGLIERFAHSRLYLLLVIYT